jgi:hypothetical protein
MAHWIIERFRKRVPYIRRLQEQISGLSRRNEELRQRLISIDPEYQLRPILPAPSEAVAGQFAAFLRNFQPHDVTGFEKSRLGAEGDGGYVMLDDFGAVRSALSLGIGQDVSWDTAIAKLGIYVFQFDHTVRQGP